MENSLQNLRWYIQNKIDLIVTRYFIWSLKEGYGADCETSDLDDFPEDYKKPKDVFLSRRCGSCRTKEIINWLEKHIDIIKN